jgi:hypothetical protein
MADIVIPDVPDDVLAAVDANARRHGLSRSDYLRRRLVQLATPRADGDRSVIEGP